MNISFVWAVFTVLLAVTLLVNAVQAALGIAPLAYWHYFTLAISALMTFACADEEKEDQKI